jgi:Flp pilus assembly protein TadG
MRMRSHRSIRGEEGAAAVEFAIVVSLLFTIIFGITEFGLALFELQNLRSSAREGARSAAVEGTRTEIRDALVAGASGSLPTTYSTSAFQVTVDGTSTSADQPCSITDAQGKEVRVLIPVSTLPANVQSAFSIDIPFIPHITLNPTIAGSFRCE